MLVEKPIRQIAGDRERRLMADEELALIVWYSSDGSIFGFELTYGAEEGDHCFRWTTRDGAMTAAIDWGKDKPGRNRTPILVAGDPFPKQRLIDSFRARSERLDDGVRDLVMAKIEQYNG